MNNTMTLDYACEIIETFADVNQMDGLSAIEALVKYYRQISPLERKALEVFMDETKKG
jgi:hypothetical protein